MNKGDMKLAQSYFKKAKQALPPRESYTETRLQIVANIARTLMEMEAYSHAVTLLKSNLKSCWSIRQSDSRALAVPLEHALGFAHVQLGETHSGICLLEACYKVAIKDVLKLGKKVKFAIMHDLATAYRDQK